MAAVYAYQTTNVFYGGYKPVLYCVCSQKLIVGSIWRGTASD